MSSLWIVVIGIVVIYAAYTFYARRIHLAALADAAARADIGIVNNAAKLEAYADDLRKMHAFAEALLPHIKA